MPIRLNLLAEQQAAEEARRRDPVKRAAFAGGALVLLMLFWALMLQIRLASAKAELTQYEAKLQSVEENSKGARLRWATMSQIESNLGNLRRYSTNRFFCANLLDALQQLKVDEIRIVELQSSHSYLTNSQATFKTNLVFPIETHRAWQFWKARPPRPDFLALVSNQISAITNKVESLKAPVELITKIDLTTNQTQAAASVEIIKPLTAIEQVTLVIKARDYGNPPGRHVDEFSKALSRHPYFAKNLRAGEGEGIRLRERAIQPELDPLDPVNPNRPFIPFVIECRYRPVTRANE
jgi:hypothetical protein